MDGQPEYRGSQKVKSNEITSPLTDFPSPAPIAKVQCALSAFTGCQRGIYVTVADIKMNNECMSGLSGAKRQNTDRSKFIKKKDDS